MTGGPGSSSGSAAPESAPVAPSEPAALPPAESLPPGESLPPAPAPAPAQSQPAALLPADASLLALVDRLSGLLERSDLLELEVEAGGTAIILRKAAARTSLSGSPGPAPAAPAVDAAQEAPADPPHNPSVAAAEAPARETVLAPLTGIFYSAPSPGSPPFVEAGREVVVGQVIGLIEAMKLFNEIKSDKAGRVVRVFPDNGTLVKAKQPLIEVEPL
jgi:acetyl-CoA carboxylase biotin carboxyl carrier protein